MRKKEKWTNKGNDNQEDADSVLQNTIQEDHAGPISLT